MSGAHRELDCIWWCFCLCNVQAGNVSEEEVRLFISSRKPEMQDHPRLLLALGAHLALPFCDAKMDAIGQTNMVSSSVIHPPASVECWRRRREFLRLRKV